MKRMPLGLGLISAVSFACTAMGCAAQQKILGQPVHRQVAIVVHISDEVNAADQAGGVAELVQTIADGLKDRGMDSEIYTAADDHPPAPRIELNVVYWSENEPSVARSHDDRWTGWSGSGTEQSDGRRLRGVPGPEWWSRFRASFRRG